LFAIHSGNFLNNPLLFGFNTTKRIFLFLHIFDFEGPSRRQTDPKFLSCHFFWEIKDREKKKSMGDAMRQERGGPHGCTPSRMVGPTFPLVCHFDAILDYADSS
jgi:hypothetical protein